MNPENDWVLQQCPFALTSRFFLAGFFFEIEKPHISFRKPTEREYPMKYEDFTAPGANIIKHDFSTRNEIGVHSPRNEPGTDPDYDLTLDEDQKIQGSPASAALRILRPQKMPPPDLPLEDLLGQNAKEWVLATAEGAGAPVDYVFIALLCMVGSAMGNSRWVSPWQGWAEPPILWGMAVGNPSAGKSPAIDSVMDLLRRAEQPIREAAKFERQEWEERVQISKVAHAQWEKDAARALKNGQEPPPVPSAALSVPEPQLPRLLVNDSTVERLGVLLGAQPKGILQLRDELAGWLLSMAARNGGSDRAFFLEAYGGRGYTVERMSRAPLTISRLTVGVLGGIQPDRLAELLVKSCDDGLLARFIPVWPKRGPIKQPEVFADQTLADTAVGKLVALQMSSDNDGIPQPAHVFFDDGTKKDMNEFRCKCAQLEENEHGLLVSFIGKLPGMAARISLIFAAIDHAFEGSADPALREITKMEFDRARLFLQDYALPMARRCYAGVAISKEEQAAHQLVKLIREMCWSKFSTRVVLRAERAGIATENDLNSALKVLESFDLIRPQCPQVGKKGGRPKREYTVNPEVHQR